MSPYYARLSKCAALADLFTGSVSVVYDHIGVKAFKPVSSFNAAVFDAILTGVSRRVEKGPIQDLGQIAKSYQEVLASGDFQLWTSRSTADDEVVKKRLQLATNAFVQVP